jgi:two-component system, chemotaxis family, response regulator WspR
MRMTTSANAVTRSRKSTDHDAMVLLVDDQVIIAEAVRRALAGEPDIHLHFCPEPAEAVMVARQIAPTLILQDLVMPGTDGLSLVRAYRANDVTRGIPVVVLSTREDPETKGEAFAAGANDYLVKLPDRIELIARVRYHSRAYLNQLQRDDAYRALRESQRQLMDANIELQRLTNLDGLTGLNNRRRFDEYAAVEWRRAIREQINFALLVVDVDDFKRFNDTYGHVAGDDALKSVAAAIRASCTRPADLPARFGGEEFAVILPGADAAGALHLAESIRRAVRDLQLAHSASTTGPFLSLSVGGVATIPDPSTPVLEAIVCADGALYEAKHAGKNRTIFKEMKTRPL